ncbi:GntR family transcriptional regulator [Rhodococcus erythropolis]|uniref:GntR family transcriptional regulator n=1 Tax=Rhodococcus TaxID=1827 RepID=UPI001423838A|nr:GntR family transcriptional regulator [Rhodococcus sp. P-2]NHP17643.1 GntR family transcriptional regulator [Rhodococcus sp. IC4_135]QQM20536.1 GntR family transcriptional regulator [Rhodococcus sp. P-2]
MGTKQPAGSSADRSTRDPKQSAVFQPLARTSLRSDATRLLRARISSGELESGRLYAIGDIAAQLEVSPTPVREALLDLKSQGLIEMVRNRGFRIVELTDDELEEIVEVRLMLEPPAMAKVAVLDPPLDLTDLWTLSKRVENAAAEGDLVSFLTLDKDFHLELLAALGNARLVKVVEQLRDQTRLSGLKGIAGSKDLVGSAREHDQLLKALQSRDPVAAEAVMTAHLHHVSGLWAGRSEKSD